MVNNYSEISDYLLKCKCSRRPIILQYASRECDTGEKTDRSKKEFYKDISQIDMDHVINICEEKKARCYLVVVEMTVESLFSRFNGNFKSLTEWINSGAMFEDLRGFHLIDVDNKPDTADIKLWLKNAGARRIKTFKSKTGNSIVFSGPMEILSRYIKTVFAKKNSAHTVASINLYIPNSITNGNK